MDITNAILAPELGCSAFTVERLTYTRTADGTTSRSATHQAISLQKVPDRTFDRTGTNLTYTLLATTITEQ